MLQPRRCGRAGAIVASYLLIFVLLAQSQIGNGDDPKIDPNDGRGHLGIEKLSLDRIKRNSPVTGDGTKKNKEDNRSLTIGQAEPRYNLATKVMSNGVEVIVATDRSTRLGEPEFLRLLSSTVTRPITLAPHTLTNHMSMVLPTDYINEAENELVSSLHPANAFVTKTYYTTYTYLSTSIVNSKTEVSSMKTVISNIQTEEVSKTKDTIGNVTPASAVEITLNASPVLQTEVYHTTYTYMNTILDGDQPLVLTSKHTVLNTVVGVDEYFNQLEPSEVFPTTNTYLKTVEFTKTLTDGTDYQVISTKDILTQVVVTDKPERQSVDQPLTTDVTKTYFVTYTYFSTYLDGDKTKVKSDVSVSSDVTIEKFYVKPKKTETKTLEKNTRLENQNEITETMPFSILATKTHLTTFTYFTTLLQGAISEKPETKISSRTRVVQNLVTETLSPQDLDSNYLKELKSSFDNKPDSPIITTAVLKGGEKLEITAFKGDVSDIVYEKLKMKPTKSYLSTKTDMDFNEIEAAENNLELMKTKFNTKSTTSSSKTKTTLFNKQKTKPIKTISNDITAEALIGLKDDKTSPVTPTPTSMPLIDPTNHNINPSQSTPIDYSTSMLSSPTVTSNGATLLPGEQVIVLRDKNGQPSVIPVSDPAKKKQQVKDPNNSQNSDLANLNPLGMNVLGPVFNAMAQLINNNLNTKPKDVISKRNDTVPMKKVSIIKKPTSANTNPITNFGSSSTTVDPKNKATTSRTPVYIPVGSFADSDFGESQDSPSVALKNTWHEKWTDTQPKNNYDKRPHDPSIAILESGIPISPGQIITTNSDVIIGRPGALGPRPPNFALKNSAPSDMKPPPLNHYHQPIKIDDDVIGQHSTNQGIDPDIRKEEDLDMVPPPPPIKPNYEQHVHSKPIYEAHAHAHAPKPVHESHVHVPKPIHESHGHAAKPIHESHVHAPKPTKHGHHPHVHNHYKIQFHKHKHDPHDDGAIDLNPPPLPPPVRPSMEIRPITINHQPHEIIPYKPTHIGGNILPIPVHLGPNENVDNYVNPAEMRPDTLSLPSVPIVNNAHQERGQPSSEPTPSIHLLNPNNIHILPNLPNEHASVMGSQNPHFIDRSTGHPLLVNIQPSQVANVVIPQGTTAVIIGGQKEHSLKGQVIDDPSPHSEPETVGLFGAEPVLKLENGDLGLSNQNEVLPSGTEGGKPVAVPNENRPNDIVHIRPKPNYNDIGMKPPQYSPPSYQSQEVYKHPNHHSNHQPYPSPNYPSVTPPQRIPPPIYDPTLPYDDHNSLKVSNGIYVDVSSSGRLPPPETGNNIQLRPINDFHSNYPTGQDQGEPLNVNVQVGYATNVDPNINGNNYIGLPTNHTHGNGDFNRYHENTNNYHENTNYVKSPTDVVPENLSPPPPPKQQSSGRPARPQNHRYQSSHNPLYSPASKPLEFMVPPPQVSHKPTYKPHSEVHIRPIPIGGGLEHNYPSPRPEDILIVPPNVRPDNQYQNFNYPPQGGNQGDLDIGDSNDPLETEDGEEIQESNSRPLLPGQLPSELEKLNRTQTIQQSTTEKSVENNNDSPKINIEEQTTNFGVNNDKTDVIDSRNQTDELNRLPAKTNTKNEMKTESSKLNTTLYQNNDKEETDVNMNEAEKIFGSKLPGNDNNKPVVKPTRKPSKEDYEQSKDKEISTASEINDILIPPKIPDVKKTPEEVMGLSPPPYERPRRPVRPPRPKPPYKFEIPTTPKTTASPITMENDFPPVRSPEYTRKPIKPQDIFPPRLPEDFVYHVPDFQPVRTPKPRPETRYPVKNKDRPTVTSLPIDVPGSSTTEKPNARPTDSLPNDSRDSYFSNLSPLDINGHSKPVGAKEESVIESMRPPPPPPPPTQSRPKPTISQRPPVIYPRPHQKPPQESKKPLSQILREQIRPSHINNEIYRTTHYSPTPIKSVHTSQTHKNWKDGDVIVGSEIIFDPDKFNKFPTPSFKPSTERKNIVTTLVTSGSTTIFGDVYTVPITLEPTKVKSTPIDFKKTTGYGSKENVENKQSQTKHVYPTYTTTLTVTTTMTTVVHSIGQKPSTKTVVLTKTLISTIVDKVTEIKTLVQPTTATVTQTHTISTTKTTLVVPTAGHPPRPKYPTGVTLKPEIFIEDPHSKDTMTISVSSSMNKNKKKPDVKHEADNAIDQSENESILVVMTDKNPKFNFTGHRNHFNDGEDDLNDIHEPNILLGGVLLPGGPKDYKDILRQNECLPECKATRNELCQKHEGTMKCVCRPGFARMFPDRPCKPTYTYNMKLTLEKLGGENIGFGKDLNEVGSPKFTRLASATKEGLDRMIMQSDLRDVYHGVIVNGFQAKKKKAMVDFHVQLSENTEESRLMDVFKKTLRTSNFSLGGTELFAAREADNLEAQDFNECSSTKFHDCSENARCFNLKGTYTCSCKEGFTDLSQNAAFPGRVCSDMIGCEYCGYHGTCYTRGDDQMTCECFQWYSGDRCRINLKVLLIALVTIGAILLALLLVCIVLTCLKRRSRSTNTSRANGSSGYLRYRGPPSQAMDKRAMIADSSSESSVENLPYINAPPPPTGTLSAKRKPVLRQHNKGPAPRPIEPPAIVPMEQRDRSVTVMIPRAKYRPIPPISPHLTMSTFSPDKHLSRTAAQISTEQKLLSYLEGNAREATLNQQNRIQNEQKIYDYKLSNTNLNDGPRSLEYNKKEHRVFEYEYKTSNMNITDGNSSGDRRSSKHGDSVGRFRRHSDSTNLNSDQASRSLQHRKYSTGALVSAGFEVSATVGLRHRDDDMLEEENSAILNTSTMKSNRSQFTTLNRTGDHKTMSEARSYDETTIHPPTRSLKTHYSGSSHSRVNNDEGHTMVERDLGSTFLMPESHLFKQDRDRGSDISNFDSL